MLKVFVTTFICFISLAVSAQNNILSASKSPLHLSGSADAYYRYNFNAPAGSVNNYTKFTNSQNSFELGMASLKAEDTIGKVSATVNLGFGQRVNEYSYTSGSNNLASAIKELFISYAVSDKVKFTVGKWYKHTGYESVDAYFNKNYSMSYGFSFGPMFFTGLKTNIALSNQVELMAGIANPADFFTTTSSTKTIIGGLSYHSKNNKLLIKVNGQGYSGISAPYRPVAHYLLYKKFLQVDVVAAYRFSGKFDVAFNYSDQTGNDGIRRNMNSSVMYVNYKINPATQLSFRNEYLKDQEYALRIGANAFASTLSANFRINSSLVIIPEIRYDRGSYQIFQKSDFLGTDNTFTALAAVVYNF